MVGIARAFGENENEDPAVSAGILDDLQRLFPDLRSCQQVKAEIDADPELTAEQKLDIIETHRTQMVKVCRTYGEIMAEAQNKRKQDLASEARSLPPLCVRKHC